MEFWEMVRWIWGGLSLLLFAAVFVSNTLFVFLILIPSLWNGIRGRPDASKPTKIIFVPLVSLLIGYWAYQYLPFLNDNELGKAVMSTLLFVEPGGVPMIAFMILRIPIRILVSLLPRKK